MLPGGNHASASSQPAQRRPFLELLSLGFGFAINVGTLTISQLHLDVCLVPIDSVENVSVSWIILVGKITMVIGRAVRRPLLLLSSDSVYGFLRKTAKAILRSKEQWLRRLKTTRGLQQR